MDWLENTLHSLPPELRGCCGLLLQGENSPQTRPHFWWPVKLYLLNLHPNVPTTPSCCRVGCLFLCFPDPTIMCLVSVPRLFSYWLNQPPQSEASFYLPLCSPIITLPWQCIFRLHFSDCIYLMYFFLLMYVLVKIICEWLFIWCRPNMPYYYEVILISLILVCI